MERLDAIDDDKPDDASVDSQDDPQTPLLQQVLTQGVIVVVVNKRGDRSIGTGVILQE
jgi:hypothetical protein